MEMSFDHVIVCHGPVVAWLRLLAYTVSPVLLWRVLQRPVPAPNLVLPSLAVSLLPYLLTSLAGFWNSLGWLTGLRLTASASDSLVWACLTGSLDVVHSGLLATVALLLASVVAILRRFRLPTSATGTRRLSVPFLVAIVAALVLSPALLFSHPLQAFTAFDEATRAHAHRLTLYVFVCFICAYFLASAFAVVLAFLRRPPCTRPPSASQAVALLSIAALLLVLSFSLSFLPGHNQQFLPWEWGHTGVTHGGP